MVDSRHAFFEISRLYDIFSSIGDQGASFTKIMVSIDGAGSSKQRLVRKRVDGYCEAGFLQKSVPRYQATEWYLLSETGKKARDSAGEIICMEPSEEMEERIRNFVERYHLVLAKK